MASDLKIDIDGVRLNVRVGVIMRYHDDIIIEISAIGRNSVIPGGRIKINESSLKSLAREIKEEMGFEMNPQQAVLNKVFENFFTYENKDFHEIYFLYEYVLSQEEYKILKLSQNEDNDTTYFKFVSKHNIEKYNLLPLELHEIIKK